MQAVQTRSSGPYNGNGATTSFAYGFRILDQSEIEVTLYDSDGVGTIQTLTTHYTVSGVGDANGGSISMVTAPAIGETLRIGSATALKNEVDLSTNGDLLPEETEEQLDRLTMIGQDQAEELGRTIKAPVGDTLDELPSAANRASKALIFDENGALTVGASISGLAVTGTQAADSIIVATGPATSAWRAPAAARTTLELPHWIPKAGAPDANDDGAGTGGLSAVASGSFCFDTAGGALYQCTDPATGAAVWERLDTTSGISNVVEDTTPQLGGPLDTNNQQVRWSKGGDVASAGALTLGTDGNVFDITGTTAITSIGTLGVGTVVMLQFDDALTLTHHATDLILPGGANITTAAGDIAIFTEYATGDWRCVSYQAAATAPGAGGGGLELIAAGSVSAAAAFAVTDLSSDYAAYLLMFQDLVSANDAVNLYLRTSTDNGSSHDNGASEYGWTRPELSAASYNYQGSSGDTKIDMLRNCSNVATEPISGTIWLYNPSDASEYTRAKFDLEHINSSSVFLRAIGFGERLASEDVDAFQMLFSSGNIATMDYWLYGLRAS